MYGRGALPSAGWAAGFLLCLLIGCQKNSSEPGPSPASHWASLPKKPASPLRDQDGQEIPWPGNLRLGKAAGGLTREIRDIKAAPSGARFAMVSGKTLIMVDGEGEERLDLPCHVNTLAWGPEGKRLAAVCLETFADGDEPERVILVSAEKMQVTGEFRAAEPLCSVAVAGKGQSQTLALGAVSGNLLFTDLEGKEKGKVKVFEEDAVFPTTFLDLLLSPDQSLVMAIGNDVNALVRIADRKVTPLNAAGEDSFYTAAWLPGNGPRAVLAMDNALEIWTLGDKPRRVPGSSLEFDPGPAGDYDVYLVTASNDGSRLLAANQGGVHLVSHAMGKLKLIKTGLSRGDTAILSADGKKVVATPSIPMSFRVMDANDLSLPEDSHLTGIDAYAFSPGGVRAASIDFDGRLLVWEVDSGKLAARFDTRPPSQGSLVAKHQFVAWTGPDHLVAGHHIAVNLVDLKAGTIGPLEVEGFDNVEHVAGSADGSRLVTMTRFGGKVSLFEAKGAKLKPVWSKEYKTRGLYTETPCRVGISANGSRFFVQSSASQKGSLQVFGADGEELARFDADATCHGTISGDGKRVAMVGPDREDLKVFELASKREVYSFHQHNRDFDKMLAGFSDPALDRSGELLAVVWLSELRVYPVAKGGDDPLVVIPSFGVRDPVFTPGGDLWVGELSSLLRLGLSKKPRSLSTEPARKPAR